MSQFKLNTLAQSCLRIGGLLVLTSALAGCGGGGGGSPFVPGDQVDAAPYLTNYARNVVLATYETLSTRAATLATATADLIAAPTAANVTAAQAAWVATREPWEQSEGFLFGPVDNQGLDPAMDSWPVNKIDLDAVLASSTPLTPQSISSFEDTLRGFHTIEYLLFSNGVGSRDATDIAAALSAQPRRAAYLDACAQNLALTAETLASAWRASDGNYVNEFLTAGTGSTIYPSQRAAMQELVEGMKGIADEVANGKITDPFTEQDGSLEESQFSDNSLEDFSDNIRSIQNAYLGTRTGSPSSTGLTQFVRTEDAALDTQIRAAITQAIDSIQAIPPPFRTAIGDPRSAAAIQTAIDDINALFDLLNGELAPLVLDTEFEH